MFLGSINYGHSTFISDSTSENTMTTTPYNSNIEERPFIEIDPDMVQVKASKAELERRIAAFTSRKRAHLDSSNRVEFCGSGGAARVAAVLGRSRGSKGHLRKTNADDASHVLSGSGPSKQMKFFTALLLRENHNFPSSGFQNKTSFLFETRQPRTHVRVLG